VTPAFVFFQVKLGDQSGQDLSLTLEEAVRQAAESIVDRTAKLMKTLLVKRIHMEGPGHGRLAGRAFGHPSGRRSRRQPHRRRL
jgi:hypothetical protein